MRPEDLAVLPEKMEKLVYELQDRIMSDVVRRIRKTGEITSTADYQLVKTQWLGQSTEYVETKIKEMTGKSWPEMFELYDRVIEQDYTRYAALYEQVNSTFLPFEKNTLLQNWTQAILDQTQNEITNITQSLGFAVSYGNGRTEFWPLSRYYQEYLDNACMDIVTGSFDYNTVLRRTVKQMTDSGIRDVRFPSGNCQRAPVAVRRAVMTGVNQLSAKLNEYVGAQLGAEYYEVTAHISARPEHAVWQGQVYTKQELADVCGLGEVDGLCGANCRHNYMPFFPGISTRAYTDEELEAIREEDEKERSWNGQTYTCYEATQKQRQMEATMRAQRADIKQLKEGHADPETIQAAQVRYLNTLHQYQSFSNAVELKPQMERVYIDGLGRMSGGRIPIITANEYGKLTAGAKIVYGTPEWSSVVNEAIRAKEPIYAPEFRSFYHTYDVKRKENFIDVVMHGSQYYTEYEHEYNFDAKTLAAVLSGRKDTAGQNIRLVACNAGVADEKGHCVAQELADRLGVDVYAPEGNAEFWPGGEIKVRIGRRVVSAEEGFKLFPPHARR